MWLSYVTNAVVCLLHGQAWSHMTASQYYTLIFCSILHNMGNHYNAVQTVARDKN